MAFNAVGVLGFTVQLVVLAVLLHVGAQYLLATAIAVEAAVLHNFFWHERWTWRERLSGRRRRLARLGRFHLLNGLVSLAGNLLLMRLLAGALGMSPLAANLIAVVTCGLLNFVASDRLVFDSGFRIQDQRFGIRDQGLAIRSAERSASATNVNVAFVQPPVGSVGDPATNRLS